MINTVFTYNSTASFGDYTIQDIYSKSLTLNSTQVSAYSNWFYTVLVQDGQRLEELANTIYDNANLWDIIFIINNMDTVFDLPKSSDYVYSVVQDRLNNWVSMFPNTTTDRLSQLEQQFLEEETAKNELHRYVTVLYPQYLPRFQELLNV